jgi:zinc transport system substrate-binding protein
LITAVACSIHSVITKTIAILITCYRQRIKRRLTLILGLAGIACGCGGSGNDDPDVVAAFYPLAFAAERVAEPDVVVHNLTPPGVEPHDFELSGRDVEAVAGADLVLYLGHGFQPALEDAIEATGANAIDLLERIDLLEPPAGHGEPQEHSSTRHPDDELDPHAWLDPTMYATMVERIGQELGRPDESEMLITELDDLDAELELGLANCERREIVTSHTAFGYLARRYELEQIGITGLSPEAEPAPGELRDLVEEIREHGATTVFFETLVSPRLAETIAREVGAETAVLNPLEGLTEDEVEAGADYFSVMRDNLRALREALGCR